MKYRLFPAMLATMLACLFVASACSPTAGPAPSPSNLPAVTAMPASTVLPTPTARLLRRAGEAGSTGAPIKPNEGLPPDQDSAATPDYAGAVAAMPRVGSPAPDFSARTMDGGTVKLSALRGHPVILNFWASWCVACRSEAPELEKLYEAYRSRGLLVLGVHYTANDTLSAGQAYVSDFKFSFPIPLDEQGSIFDAYRVPGLPTTFFVDGQGIIRNFVLGQMGKDDLAQGLDLIKTW